jgi:serine/threonine protein kinase
MPGKEKNMTDFTGKIFGSYKLLHVIGRGGYASVYEAVHTWLGTHVAVKILDIHVNPRNIRAIRRSLKEALIANYLKHPHIIPILDCNIHHGIPYIVMPYMKNGSLCQVYPEGVPLPWATIIEYVRQVAETLTFIHANNFIYQDVKPENMLVGDDGSIFLSDFGTVIFIQKTHLYYPQMLIGTVRYMAPERFTNIAPTPASDIYSLAVVVFEWLTGEPPFLGSTLELIRQHRFVIPSTKRMTELYINPAIQHVLLKALAKNPFDRYQSAAEFFVDLESAGRMPEQLITKDKLVDKWVEMSFIFTICLYISVFLGVGLYFADARLVIDLLIIQVCLVLLPILSALIRKNWLAIRFALVIPVIAGVIGFLLHSWLSSWWVLPISLIVSSIFGLLHGFRN